ncbi:MAG TPA: hypothetical protein PK360_18645, partial [bacterium]|nr:hypothetical protein [bacterium]
MFNPDQLNAWAESWASLAWRSTVDSTLALGLVGMVWLVFRKHLSVQAGYVLFLLVFLKLLVPGFVSLPGLIHPWLPVQRIGTGISGEDWGWGKSGRPAGVGNNPTTGDMDAAPAIGENLTGSTELSGTFWLMLVWWLITGFLCLRF